MGAVCQSVCIEHSFGITVELIGGVQFRCAKSAVDKKFDDVRKLRDRIRPAPGNLQREQFDLGKIPFTVP